MSIFHQRFTTGQVVAATGLPNATLQSWIKRELVTGQKDDPIEGGGSPGVHRQFSFFNVMEIAIAKGLTDVGLSASSALKAARYFAHSAHGSTLNPVTRRPGVPYDSRKHGLTLLCVAGDQSTTYRMSDATNSMFAEVRHALGRPRGFVVLEVNPIFEQVTYALGYKHLDVLAAAYD